MVGVFRKAGILGVLFFLSLSGCDFRRVVVNDPLVADSLEGLVPGKSTIQDVDQEIRRS